MVYIHSRDGQWGVCLLYTHPLLILYSKLKFNLKLFLFTSSPERMNITFILFTKQLNTTNRFGYNPSIDQLKNSKFSPKRKTVFIIHGFGEYYEECEQGLCKWMAVIN